VTSGWAPRKSSQHRCECELERLLFQDVEPQENKRARHAQGIVNAIPMGGRRLRRWCNGLGDAQAVHIATKD
jgi:hypothetical protein